MATEAAPQSAPAYDYIFKLVLIGDSEVGKTCLLKLYVDGKFEDDFQTTVGVDFMIKTLEVDGKKIKLQMWDTAGQERFRTVTSAYYRGAQGIIVVYDVTERASFDHVTYWFREIGTHASNGASKLLVGNKSDCSDPVRPRQVSTDEGKELADSLSVDFIETSALKNDNVQQVFEKMAKEIKEAVVVQPSCVNAPDVTALPAGRSVNACQRIGCCQ
jgi:Ras-related protein Rab-1A